MDKPIISLLLAVFLTGMSCTVQQSYLTGSHCNSKCTYLRMGVGRAKAYSVWGIGSGKMENLIFAAKNNLYRAFPLQRTEFYDNFVVNIKNTYFPFVKKSIVTIHVDIVTDDMEEGERAFSSSYYEYLGYPQTNKWGIALTDSVVFVREGKLQKGVVIDLDNHRATVMQTHQNVEKFLTLPIKRLYAIENENLEEECGCEAGEILEVSAIAGKSTRIVKIIGLQKGRQLVAISQNNKTSYRVGQFKK